MGELQSPVRQKYGYDTTHRKHIRDLVDYRARFKLLRRHESGRSKHPSHLVGERPVAIMIQINQTQGLRYGLTSVYEWVPAELLGEERSRRADPAALCFQ